MTDKTPRLTISEIRKWAKAHFERKGKWPGRDAGPVIGGPDISWSTVDRWLRRGGRGLPGGSSLSELIRKSGGQQNLRRREPGLSKKRILEWADHHRDLTGQWPDRDSGPVKQAPHITWATIDKRLRYGGLNLDGGTTLTRLLREHRGVWDRRGNTRLTAKLILKWADAHYYRTGYWPVTLSGKVVDAPGANEQWATIDVALRDGRRGLPGSSSLAQLLEEHRKVPVGKRTPKTVKKAGRRLKKRR